MEHHGISIVIPVYNEENNLPRTIGVIAEQLRYLEKYEIIVIDDGSIDNTWDVITDLSTKFPFICGIRFTRNFGKEAAIYAGLQNSVGEAAIVIDADLQHPPHLIPKMLDLWKREKAPIVEAIKEIRQSENIFRRFGAHLFYNMFSLLGLPIRHSTDYKLLDRIVIDQFIKFPERNRFFRGLTTWMGFRKETIRFIPDDRNIASGKSRWSFFKLFQMAIYSLLAFTTLPLRIVTWLGGMTLFISIILSFQTLWKKFNGHAVEGFTTVILIELFIGSIIMISLGLIGEYLSCVYEEIKGRPVYIISDYLNMNRSDNSFSS